MRTITASEANRNFSSVLRDVVGGESILIVSRGTPVAKIGPVEPEATRQSGKKSLLERLEKQHASGMRDWTRDELYSDTICG
jgi:prevent-host-death family protein